MEKIRVGFIGVGGRGAANSVNVVTNFADRAEVVAVSDLNPANMDKCASEHTKAPEKMKDWQQLLSRRDIDAVCISTPQFAHREIGCAAFAAGKHVYCEKPLALNVTQCDEMLAAASKAKKVFCVGQQMRYHAHLRKMSSLIDEGRIGPPQMTWLTEYRNPFPVNMRWAFDKSKSSGAIMEKSCHHFDLFAWMLRGPAVRVFASGGQAVYKQMFGFPSDVIDHCWVIIEHEGGRRALLGLCFFAGLPHTSENFGTHVRDIGVIGQRGMILTEGFRLGADLEVRYSDKAQADRIVTHPPDMNPEEDARLNGNYGIWEDFFNCIRNGGAPFASGKAGRDAVAVAQAAELSIEKGRVIEMSEIG